MKKVTISAISFLFFVPSVSFAAALTSQQATSLIGVVQSSPGVPASAFTSLITSFSNISVAQANSLIGVVQAAPGVPASAFISLLTSFTVDASAAQTTTPTIATVASPSALFSPANSECQTIANDIQTYMSNAAARNLETTMTYNSNPAWHLNSLSNICYVEISGQSPANPPLPAQTFLILAAGLHNDKSIMQANGRGIIYVPVAYETLYADGTSYASDDGFNQYTFTNNALNPTTITFQQFKNMVDKAFEQI